MRPAKLTMSAFGPYASTVEVPFSELGERGVYLITGDTGAGKTTIFDAISYALFGDTSDERRPAAALRSDFADPELPTEVELEFDYAGKRYAIRRTPAQERPKKKGEGMRSFAATAWLRLPDGKEIEGVQAVNRAVAEILSMDARQFRQIVMIAQGQFRRLLVATSDERRAIFRDLFGTEPYGRVQRELKDRKMALYKADAEARTRIASALQPVKVTGGERQAELEELRGHAAVKGDAVLGLLEAQEAVDDAEEERLDGVLAELAAEASDVDGALREAARRARVESELARARERAATSEGDYERALAARDEAEGERPRIAELALQVRHLQAALADLERLDGAKADLDRLDAQMGAFEGELAEARGDLERALGARSPEVPPEITGAEALERSIGAAREGLRALRDRAAELEGALGQRSGVEAELEELAGRREALAEERGELDALMERAHAATDRHGQATEAYERARDRAERALAIHRELERRFLDEQAGILAESLAEGEPCPVCGSREHPAPAARSESCPSQAEVDDAREASERAREAAASASRAAGEAAAAARAARQALDDFVARHGDAEALEGTRGRLAARLSKKEEEARRLEARCRERTRALEDAELLEASIQRAATAKEDVGRRSRDLAERRASLQATVAVLVEGLPARSLAEANEKVARANARIRELEAAREGAQSALEAASTALGDARAQVKERLRTLEELPRVDVAELEERRRGLEDRRRALTAERDVVHARRDANANARRELSTWLRRYGKLQARHAVVDRLSDAANGSLPNTAKITFETFVQQAHLDRVIAAANRRLAVIANGRYELTRPHGARNLRQQTGLDLAVHDHRTGKERDVATLSGGESFEASLSLALGLSDVVQAHAGGIRLDTLFVDEGFGSLDAEALQNAIRMLTSLAPEDKLVGIISHVDALRESIGCRIVVESGREGSSLSVEV